MIAILASVPQETALIRKALTPWDVLDCSGLTLYRSKMGAETIELLHGGIGKANAASAATLLAQRRPTALLTIGSGGAFPASGLAVGDLALATCEIFGDEGVQTPQGFLDLQGMKLPLLTRAGVALYNEYPVDPLWLHRAEGALASFSAALGIALRCGPFVTVSTCSGTAAAGADLGRRTGGICENMEGAAIALICARQGIPFCEVRGISNLVEDRDPTRWDLAGAARVAQQALLALLDNAPGEVPA